MRTEPGKTSPIGAAAWPRGIADLTDTTRCPACFSALHSVVCSHCALDLSAPQAHELAQLSGQIAHQLGERVTLIERMRVTSAAARAAQNTLASPAPALPAPATELAAPALAQTHVADTPTIEVAPAARAPQPALAPAGPRRSGVQIALLITGISLLSVFAVFFLVYAFINYGLIWRSTIIAAVTVAAFVSASLLRRRKLTASAEAVAVFALLLVYLDAFAVRANSLAGTDQVDGRAYWGFVLVGSAIAFILWHRVAGVRAASIVGYSVFAPGVGVVASAFTESPDAFSHLSINAFTICIAVAVGAFIHVVAIPPRIAGASGPSASHLVPERVIAISTGFVALICAGGFGLIVGSSQLPAPLPLAICSGVALVHATVHGAVLRTWPSSLVDIISSVTYAAAAGAGLSLGAATAMIYTLRDAAALAFVAPALAFAVTIGLLLVRTTGAVSRTPANAATIAAASIAAMSALPAAVIAIGQFGRFLTDALDFAPAASGTAQNFVSELDLYSVAALALAVVVAAAGLRLLGYARQALPWLATAGVIVALIATPLLPSVWFTLAASAALGTIGLIVRRRHPGALRIAVATAIFGGFAVTWVGGWTADDTWIAATIVTVCALVYARFTSSALFSAALATSAAVIIGLIGVAYGGWLLAPTGSGTSALVAAAAVAVFAGALSALAALDLGWVTTLERRIVFWLALAATLIAVVTSTPAWGIDSPTSVMLLVFGGAAVTTIAAALWSVSALTVERLTAAALVAPALAVTLIAGESILFPTTLADGLVSAIAAAIAAALGLFWTAAPRVSLDIGAAVTVVSALAVAFAGNDGTGWVVMLIAAITAGIIATSSDGLIGSAAPRRHLGWVGLLLATGALWWALDEGNISAIELFVLPPALAIATIALLIRTRRPAENPDPAATLLFFALLLAIIPIGIASNSEATGDTVRAASVLLVSAVLLIAGCAILSKRRSTDPAAAEQSPVPRRSTATAFAAACASAGLAGVSLITFLRGSDAISSPAGTLELWIAPAVVAVVSSAALLARAPRLGLGQGGVSGPRLGQNLVLGAIAVASVFEIAAIIGTPPESTVTASTRAIIVVIGLSIVHVAALASREPLSAIFARPAGWTALGFASGAAIVGLFVVETPEWVTAPIALALLASGGLQLARRSATGSWPALGTGLAVLLLPTLIMTFAEPSVWRLVALGVLGVTTIIVGVTLRLQAPFVIGTVIVLAHALRTFAPQIVAVYEAADWYVWAGIGGVLLVAIAIRYEHRMRDVKKAVGSIASLR